MKSLLENKKIQWALRLALSGVFIYAGAIKINAPQAFADNIAAFQLLPAQLINVMALSLPPFEIIVGAALLIGWRKQSAALGVLLMTLVFGGAIGYAIHKGLVIDCGCFGAGPQTPASMWKALGRDGLLLLAALALYGSAEVSNPRASAHTN